MGSDDLHHKRKQFSLKRRENIRKSRDVILIVCEGSKAEIKSSPLGNDPLNIVNFALQETNINEYDQVYCVFDKEEHTNYKNALHKINQSFINDIPIYAIPSVPCFEYWLLLHFEETTKPYQKTGKKSASDCLISDLKKHIKYKKHDREIFKKTKTHLNEAILRAERISKSQKINRTDNPSTMAHKLVKTMQSL